MEKGVEVPRYFLCPISLEIMKDPVTLSTGVTYDRKSIERWVFVAGEKLPTCPTTKQPLADLELIPNHTLRRLIQAWSAARAGAERFSSPRAPATKAQIARLLAESMAPPSQLAAPALHQLRRIPGQSELNRRTALSADAPHVLVSIFRSSSGFPSDVVEEALAVLHSLKLSLEGFSELLDRNGDLVDCLTEILRSSDCRSRAYAVLLLRPISRILSPTQLVDLKRETFEEMVRAVEERSSPKVRKAALKVLFQMCRCGKNRVKAAMAGGVGAMVELLLDEVDERVCEMAMVVLEQLCCCAEGRADLVKYQAGIAVVGKKMIRVSPVTTEKAVKVLYSVAKCSAAPEAAQEMLEVGVVSKLCLILQADCESKTKERAKEILRLNAKIWRKSPCIPPQLQASYAFIL